MRVSVVQHPCQHLVLSVFQIWAIVVDVWWYLNVVLICLSLIIYDIEHISMCMFAICVSSVIQHAVLRLELGQVAHKLFS